MPRRLAAVKDAKSAAALFHLTASLSSVHAAAAASSSSSSSSSSCRERALPELPKKTGSRELGDAGRGEPGKGVPPDPFSQLENNVKNYSHPDSTVQFTNSRDGRQNQMR